MHKKQNELFPKDFIARLPALKKISNPLIVGLLKHNNPNAVNLKQHIERWFIKISDEDRIDLGARIRSIDDKQHLSAFYELMWHDFLTESGYYLKKHPLVGSKKPDYLASNIKGEPQFFFEVITIFQKQDLERQEKGLDRLLEEISKIKHYFYVDISFDKYPPHNISYKVLKRELISWLDSFDPNAHEQGHIFRYNLGGCTIKFELNSRPTVEKKSIYCGHTYPGLHGEIKSKTIRNQIQDKIKKYKEIKIIKNPLVIAVCSSGGWNVSEAHLEAELYGKEVILFDTVSKKAKTRLDRSGLFTPKADIKGAKNTRLSAVIFCERIFREKIFYNMKVYHNPWAICPLELDKLNEFPQYIKLKEENNIITFGWRNNDEEALFSYTGKWLRN